MDKEKKDSKENDDKKEKSSFTKNIFSSFSSVFGNKNKNTETVITPETEKEDQLLLKLTKQKSLKPKIVNDDFDKNYVRANSVIDDTDEEDKIKAFTCPINKKIMEDPVITPYGTTYEKSAILDWIEKNKTDYNSDKVLTKDMLVSNYILKVQIKEYNDHLNIL